MYSDLTKQEAKIALRVLRNLSEIAWDFGATYFTDSPMNRFAMKLQSLVHEAEAAAETAPNNKAGRDE